MSQIKKPSMRPLIHGDILKRANLFRFIREFTEAQDMPKGYYMEFGVLNGECMIDAYRQFRGLFSHFLGFDSFEGLPDLSAEDIVSAELMPIFHQGNYASMQYEYVKKVILNSCRMEAEELTLVKGLFSKSLPEFQKEELKQYGIPLVIYIDCDLYSSTVDVLHFIDDLIVTGTWIIFDDYWCYRGSPYHGEQKAIREWMDGHKRIGLQPYCNLEGWSRAFIVYEKDGER
jgi:O-methyltransferase